MISPLIPHPLTRGACVRRKTKPALAHGRSGCDDFLTTTDNCYRQQLHVLLLLPLLRLLWSEGYQNELLIASWRPSGGYVGFWVSIPFTPILTLSLRLPSVEQ